MYWHYFYLLILLFFNILNALKQTKPKEHKHKIEIYKRNKKSKLQVTMNLQFVEEKPLVSILEGIVMHQQTFSNTLVHEGILIFVLVLLLCFENREPNHKIENVFISF